MAVTCETGVCHGGEGEDPNTPWCDTLSLGVCFPTSRSLMFLQNIRKSYKPNHPASDPRRPEFSWRWHVL